MIGKGRCDIGLIWNPVIWDFECGKSCDSGEYLNYENCKCRKKLTDSLVVECNENIDVNEKIYIQLWMKMYANLVQYI